MVATHQALVLPCLLLSIVLALGGASVARAAPPPNDARDAESSPGTWCKSSAPLPELQAGLSSHRFTDEDLLFDRLAAHVAAGDEPLVSLKLSVMSSLLAVVGVLLQD